MAFHCHVTNNTNDDVNVNDDEGVVLVLGHNQHLVHR